jgi:hypothetical protein
MNKIIIIDALTHEVIERDLTDDELAERELMHIEATARKEEQEAKASARISALAKLAALGLTEAEIAAL